MKRVFLLSSSAYLLIIFSLIIRSGELLALVLVLLLYIGAGLIFGPEEIDLTVERYVSPERVMPDMPIEVTLEVTNHGGRLENMLLEDELPAGLKVVAGETKLLTSLKKGGTIQVVYTVTARRGYYRFRDVQIQAWDHLGVGVKSATMAVDARVYVQPEVQRIGRINIRPRATRVFAGFIPARKGGPGVEFFGVRQYQQGDPLRWINWRASARHHQEVFINQFEQERVADVGIILDTRRRSDVQVNGQDALFDCCVEAAAALADSFINDGNRVGLLQYGTQLDWTHPGFGKVQRERILQSLARAKPGESMIFEKLANLPKRLFPPNAQLVLISPLHSDDLPVLIHLRARGYALMVISPDPIRFEQAHLDLSSQRTSLAVRLACLERTLMLHKLGQAGIQVLDWDVNIPLEAAVHVEFSRPLTQLNALEIS